MASIFTIQKKIAQTYMEVTKSITCNVCVMELRLGQSIEPSLLVLFSTPFWEPEAARRSLIQPISNSLHHSSHCTHVNTLSKASNDPPMNALYV